MDHFLSCFEITRAPLSVSYNLSSFFSFISIMLMFFNPFLFFFFSLPLLVFFYRELDLMLCRPFLFAHYLSLSFQECLTNTSFLSRHSLLSLLLYLSINLRAIIPSLSPISIFLAFSLSFSPFLSLFPSFSPSFSLFLPLFHIVLLTFHSFLFQYFCVKTFLILLTTSCFILSRKSISAGSR